MKLSFYLKSAVLLMILVSNFSFAQSTEKNVINENTINKSKSTELKVAPAKKVTPVKDNDDKEVIKPVNSQVIESNTYPVKISSSKQAVVKEKSIEQPQTREEKISNIKVKITSLEGKIELLKDDFTPNEQEIIQKENALKSLLQELENLEK